MTKSNIRSLSEHRRLKSMTTEERIRELTEYYDDLLERHEDRISWLEHKLQELESKS
jgi:hypothetical protein